MMTVHRKLHFVAQLPPPVNGLTLISERMLSRCTASDFDMSVWKLNSSRPVGGRTISRRLSRLVSVLSLYLSILREARISLWRPSGAAFYLTPSGGIGKLLELPLLGFARLAGWQIVLHHHSFAYLNRGSVLALLMFTVAGQRAIHVCLGQTMKDALVDRYGSQQVFVISNAAFVELPADLPAPRRQQQRLALGYLGNIEISKGILDFLETVRTLQAIGIEVAAEIAGPFADDETRLAVESSLRDLRDVRLWGGVYEARKEEFLASIDALLFPTRYVNEAEPVTILECLARGVPVLASARGSIPDILAGEMAFGLFRSESFAESAAAFISTAQAERSWPALSTSAATRFATMKRGATQNLDRLLDAIR